MTVASCQTSDRGPSKIFSSGSEKSDRQEAASIHFTSRHTVMILWYAASGRGMLACLVRPATGPHLIITYFGNRCCGVRLLTPDRARSQAS